MEGSLVSAEYAAERIMDALSDAKGFELNSTEADMDMRTGGFILRPEAARQDLRGSRSRGPTWGCVMTARQWDRAIAAKVTLGLILTLAAPYVAIIGDRARVYRNAWKWVR